MLLVRVIILNWSSWCIFRYTLIVSCYHFNESSWIWEKYLWLLSGALFHFKTSAYQNCHSCLSSSPIKMLTGYCQSDCIICYNYFVYYYRHFVPRSGLSLGHWGIHYISRHRHHLIQASTFALLCSCLKEKTLMTGSLFMVS